MRAWIAAAAWCAAVSSGMAAQSGGTITGVVHDSECVGIPGTEITIRGESGQFTTHADGGGRFVFLSVRDGEYSLRAEIPGYRPFIRERVRPPATVPITLTERTDAYTLCRTVEFQPPEKCREVPAPAPQATFTVTVKDDECRPVAGARVTLRMGDNEFSARTDRNGRVAPVTPPSGEYEISVDQPGFVTAVLRHIEVPLLWRGPMVITLRRGDPSSPDIIDIPRSGSATGPRGAVADPNARQKIVIVAMGDSTTAGTPGWMSPREAPPKGRGDETSQYAYWLMMKHPDWDVRNMGVNGERSDQIRARFEPDVVAQHPAVVVILAGVNDVYQGRPAAHAIAQLKAMCERAREAGIKVVAGSIIPYNSASIAQNAAMRTINNWIREYVAADPNARFVDTRAAVASGNDPDRLASSPDGLHPDAAGYRRMADTIAPVIEQMVKESRPPRP
jgi:lysophospholipase L1-like esterase